MDDTLVLLSIFGLAAIAWFILGGIGFFIAVGQKKRIQTLETQVRKLTGQTRAVASSPLSTQLNSTQVGKSEEIADVTPDAVSHPVDPLEKATVKTATAAANVPKRAVLERKAPSPPAEIEPGFVERMVDNFKTNWVIWIGALSLALGGVFFVQYGLERGYLGPVGRVASSLIFGLALLGVAGRVRRNSQTRRSGLLTADAALAAGGIASLFAGTISAHVLYELTNGPVAFLSMAAVAWLALGAGILFGPVLAVIGLLGAFVTPALVNSDAPSAFMHLYFLLVLAATLGVERYKKWMWLSALAVVAALVWGLLLYGEMPYDSYFGFYFGGILALVITIPAFGIPPVSHDSRMFDQTSLKNQSHHYPTILAVAAAGVGAVLLVLIGLDSRSSYETASISLIVFLGFGVLLLHKTPNLDQFAAIFGVAFLVLVSGHVHLRFGPVSGASDSFGFTAVAMAVAIAICLLGAIWRAERSTRAMYWVWTASIAPVVGLGVLWFNFHEIAEVPAGYWLAGGLSLLVLQLGNAVWFHRVRERLPAGSDLFAGSAVLIALELIYAAFSGMELTVAIGGLALAAALAECRFTFAYTGRLVTALVAVATIRLVVFPGFPWALEAEFFVLSQAFAGVTGFFAIGVIVTQRAGRLVNQAVFETAASALIGSFACVLGARYLNAPFGQNLESVALYGLVWGMLALGQFVRSQQVDAMARFRILLGRVYAVGFLVAMMLALTLFNPLTTGAIKGPLFFDTLAFAYVLPAGLAYLLLRRPELRNFVPNWTKFAVPAGLIFFYLALEIRRMWQGDVLHDTGVKDGELYAYTVLMLASTLSVIALSLLLKSPVMRQIGLACVALTAGKVFLWDMSGLAGLARATSFVALGLILAGIAWLYQNYTFEPKEPDESGE